MKIGIIGLDSTHAIEFTQRLNAPTANPLWRGARIVACSPGEPTEFPLSVSRCDRITVQLRDELGIALVPGGAELVRGVDAVMILSCDGRSHLPEARPLLAFGKPIFIDKPLTASLPAVAQLLNAARQHRCPLFSASALRFRSGSARAARLARSQAIRLEIKVPDAPIPNHSDFSWHGIHGVESAFGVFGPGCATVERRLVDHCDSICARWPSGASALIKRSPESEARAFPATLFDEGGSQEAFAGYSYEPLLTAIVEFFSTGISPVPRAEMAEVIACVAAADLSRDRQGQPIHLPALLQETGVDL